jgi:hypothetical protein
MGAAGIEPEDFTPTQMNAARRGGRTLAGRPSASPHDRTDQDANRATRAAPSESAAERGCVGLRDVATFASVMR